MILALALPAPADAAGGCRTHKCEVRVARKACERGSVTGCIKRGARQHRVDEGRLLRVAWCESTFRPFATNGQYAGLFQFGPALWGELRYRDRSRFSAKWSSLAAGLAFRLGLASHWECK